LPKKPDQGASLEASRYLHDVAHPVTVEPAAGGHDDGVAAALIQFVGEEGLVLRAVGNELQEVGTQGENGARPSGERQRDEAFGRDQTLPLDPCSREEPGGLRRVQGGVGGVPEAEETQVGPE
jgi:hypothetical protein